MLSRKGSAAAQAGGTFPSWPGRADHEFVLGRGKPYFAGARPPLRLVAADPVGEDAVRLTYVPA